MLQNLEKILPDINSIKENIALLMSNKHISVQSTYNYLTESNGKMLRPALVVISAMLCDYKKYEEYKTDIYKIATTIELLHIASLVHDDVIDRADMRRGKKTINNIKGNKHAVIIGDIIISESLKVLCSLQNIDIIKNVVNIASVLSEGEIIQEDFSGNINITIDEYLDIISKKTASLFELSMKLPALLFNIDDKKISRCGFLIGTIFQLIDDTLDYDSTINTMGKNEYSDFFESKITLPIILLIKKANLDEKNQLKKIFENKIKTDKELLIINNLLQKYKIIHECKNYLSEYVSETKEHLVTFENKEIKNMLLDIIDFIVIRNV